MDIKNINKLFSNSNLDIKDISKDKNSVKFGEILNNAINKVNKDQIHADEMDRLLMQGKIDNVHDVTIAAQKAQMTLSLAIEVNKKVIDSYKEILRLQI